MSKYLESCKTDFWQEIFKKELEYIVKELKNYKNILSVGCGPAIIEKGLQENGFNVTGLDVTKETLEGAPDSIRTKVGSAENMDFFEDSSFDSVLYVASLQFINNYEKAIQETARVLKPEGKLLIMLLNPESEFFKEKRKQSDSYVNKIKHTNLKEIENIIKQHFSIEKAEYFLGIKDNNIFNTYNTKSAALYVISGVKK